MSFDITTYGNTDADTFLLQMVDDHDLEFIESEVSQIRELTGGQDFCLKAVKVGSWNRDLSPWPAPPVFGKEGFGDGAAQTLQFLKENVLPELTCGNEENVLPDPACGAAQSVSSGHDSTVAQVSSGTAHSAQRVFIGGYSLAGLFALWAGYQTDRFDGIAAASPSIWFPHFTEYIRENSLNAGAVYLSLGDREERTRNPVMSQVGSAIRSAEAMLKEKGIDCILEWNKGNHFKDPDLRTAKAFAWLMNRK